MDVALPILYTHATRQEDGICRTTSGLTG